MQYDDIRIIKAATKRIPETWDAKRKFLNSLDHYVEFKLKKVTSTQIRNLFNASKKIKTRIDALDLGVTLRYVLTKSTTPEPLRNFLREFILPALDSIALDEINDFKEFIKTVLCYHKFHEK